MDDQLRMNNNQCQKNNLIAILHKKWVLYRVRIKIMEGLHGR